MTQSVTQDDSGDCCPKFDPIPWNEKILEWKEKRFIKDQVFTLFYVPMNFGAVMQKLQNKITLSGGSIVDNMGLADHRSIWSMDLFIAVDQEIQDAENLTFSGKYYSKVYEGSFSDTEEWTTDFESLTRKKGIKIEKQYLWYTTCPKCARKYGKNYVVIVGKIAT